MGHDTTAYRLEEKAYLRRSMGCNDRGMIYTLLDIENANCGVSGCGVEESFYKRDIEKALIKAKELNDVEPDILKFLEDCLDGLVDSYDKVLIRFA